MFMDLAKKHPEGFNEFLSIYHKLKTQVCDFGEKCTGRKNGQCLRKHIITVKTKCRRGSSCTVEDCSFLHPGDKPRHEAPRDEEETEDEEEEEDENEDDDESADDERRPAASAARPARREKPSGGHKSSYKTVPCAFFKKGECKKGDKCTFKH